MKVFILVIPMCLMVLSLYGQPVKYTYDDSGNRTKREKIMVRSITKSAVDTETTGEKKNTDDTTGYEEMLDEMKITVFPNPTRGLLRVEITGNAIPEKANISLYNVSGVLIRQLTGISAVNHFDISAQPAGTYIMRIVLDKEHVSVWKIIKE